MSFTIRGQNTYELLYLNNNFEQIISLAQSKSSADDYYWLSLALNKQGKTMKALGVLEEGIKRFENNKKLEMMISDLYYETGNYSEAKSYLEKYQDDYEIFMKLINVLEFQENYSTAIALLQNRLRSDSSNINYLSHLGDNYYQSDNIETALTYYKKAFSLNASDQSIALKLAGLYLKNKEFNKSVDICDTILKSDTANRKFIKIRGMASFNKNDFVTARTCFNFLYQNGDTGKFITKRLGICEFNNSKFISSRRHLKQAFVLDSNDFETCFFLGKAYLNSTEPEQGLYYLNRIDSLLQPDPRVLSTVCIEKQSIYSTIEDFDNAIKCYRMAYKYNPNPEYLFYIAFIYQNKLNDKQHALEYYELFIESLPPEANSEHRSDTNQITVSLRKLAEDYITKLREELFFDGKLPD